MSTPTPSKPMFRITFADGDVGNYFAADRASANEVLAKVDYSNAPVRFIELRTSDGAAHRINLAHVVIVTYMPEASVKQIGHIEILKLRVYPQDPARPEGPEVIVKPGRYPLYRDGADTFWLMHGRINDRQHDIQDLGGGTFAVRYGDRPTKVKAEVSSKRFSPEAWADLLASPEFTEGDEAQRLRVSILEGAA